MALEEFKGLTWAGTKGDSNRINSCCRIRLDEPSYDEGDGLGLQYESLPNEITTSRDAAVEAADELHHLLLGRWGFYWVRLEV